MTRYRAKAAEVEAVQWMADPARLQDDAREIIDWITDNGGYAEHGTYYPGDQFGFIEVCGADGWCFSEPGYYIVRGTREFKGRPDRDGACPGCSNFPEERHTTRCRGLSVRLWDFYAVGRAEFEERWELAESNAAEVVK